MASRFERATHCVTAPGRAIRARHRRSQRAGCSRVTTKPQSRGRLRDSARSTCPPDSNSSVRTDQPPGRVAFVLLLEPGEQRQCSATWERAPTQTPDPAPDKIHPCAEESDSRRVAHGPDTVAGPQGCCGRLWVGSAPRSTMISFIYAPASSTLVLSPESSFPGRQSNSTRIVASAQRPTRVGLRCAGPLGRASCLGHWG
jgi:hypothetical protein